MTIYNKSNHFLATITQRYTLCSPESEKHTIHIVLDLKGSGLTYQVGDSIAVQCVNGPDIVDKTLTALSATGHELVKDKHDEVHTLRDFFIRKCNLTEVPRNLISEIAQRQTDQSKKAFLEGLIADGQREALKAYQATHEVWDALSENSEVQFTAQELCSLIMPLLPRFYSIASAMSAVGEEVHLTIAKVFYEAGGHLRQGVCTNYLCDLAPMHVPSIPIYIQPANGFTLPDDGNTHIIMVGPGTGVAPFRAFMQDRIAKESMGENWLFFGEQKRSCHFFYEDYWQGLVNAGKLRLTTAFSRDQENKVYVQHRIVENGKRLFDMLEQGAHFYVCGDAQQMAKDYVKSLKQAKRYLRDVY